MTVPELKPFEIILGLPASCILFVVCRWAYRLSPFHPLAKIPTPSRWACMTEWFQYYWNGVQDGKLIFETEKWHRQLGPIIRIGPNEVHINDPTFYNTVFTANYTFPVHAPAYNWLGLLDTFIASSKSLHRARRGLITTLFSKSSIYKIEEKIRKHTANLVNAINPKFEIIDKDSGILKIERGVEPGDGINMLKLSRRLTADIISQYLFGESFNLLTSDKNIYFLQQIIDTMLSFQQFQFCWPLIYGFSFVPASFLDRVMPESLRGFANLAPAIEKHVDALTLNRSKGKKVNEILLEALVEGSTKIQLSRHAIVDDSLAIIAGGIETTGATIAEAFYRASIHPNIQARLHEELVQAFPRKKDEITLAKAEKIKYLIAFLKETLRIAPPVPGRLVRVTPAAGTTYQDTFLPSNTLISMSIYLTHMNEDVYQNPHEFDPQRWVNSDPTSPQEKYFVPFSKGSRACPAIHLAWAEMIIAIAATFRNYKLRLHPNNKRTSKWTDQIARTVVGDLLLISEEYND
ncbi:hypothetical protein TWF788_008521 [Orbilia oligospora]|uniref:Cytochrome P450 n=1 Tax=Orbilia oligospora TaxID=2813651 RepID=A0A7C8KIG3_ORBOL|nr:hypothetical protein TWF788_008521 [Orbilia oligospora]